MHFTKIKFKFVEDIINKKRMHFKILNYNKSKSKYIVKIGKISTLTLDFEYELAHWHLYIIKK